jgi:hypothetical protein
MKRRCLKSAGAFVLSVIIYTCLNMVGAQQNIIADKDNTHPEHSDQLYAAARVFLISAIQLNGYNEVRWSATGEQDTRRYIVEYSSDGIFYQSGGELNVGSGTYLLKHKILDPRTFLYRIKIEKKDGRFVYTQSVLMEGARTPAVLLYPTVVENNTVNLRMDLPVQKLMVISPDGKEVFSKQMGGQTGSTQVVIPPIARGTYYMVFQGANWKSTEKFIVGK